MTPARAIVVLLGLVLYTCRQPNVSSVEPSIEFTQLPPAGDGSPDKLHAIAGRVKGHLPGQQIVLFARSGIWWVQPTADHPATSIEADASWKNATHPGSAYAAVLVDASYNPPMTLPALPKVGGAVAATAVADGPMLVRAAVKTVRFSGYDWTLREDSSDRGGTRNQYNPENAWVDKNGFLHLRIAKQENGWTSAEVNLTRSLGYGSYRFVVRDITGLEPAAVFSIFTWDDSGPTREMNIEVSRWGEAASKNAQFVIQPYYVPANAVRFIAPAGVLTYWLNWEPGRAAFTAARGATASLGSGTVASHAFTSGIPSPGKETIHMNLYVFDNKNSPLRNGCEVVIEKFEYLP